MDKILVKINDYQENERIDKILTDLCNQKNYNVSRMQIQDLVSKGFLLKNEKVFNNNSYKVKINDEFIFALPKFEEKTLKPTSIPLNIVYEDQDLIVINKQHGLTTHPGAGNEDDTLANALLNLYKDNLSKVGGEFRPGIVHRLDKNTSGLLVVAKNDKAHLNLSNQLQQRILKRNYVAFLWDVLTPKNGQIDGYIARSKFNRLKMEMVSEEQGRYSLTNYKTINTFANNSISMVEFSLDTGRTHQIRVHCNFKKCPIIGDFVYGGRSRHLKSHYDAKDMVDNFSRQALHSYKIQFYQPNNNKLLKFEIPLADDMQNLLNKLERFKDVKYNT